MPYPHRIRLRGPWDCEPLARRGTADAPLPPPCSMRMLRRWGEGGLGDFAGRVRFRRRFGYPGRIDVHERVWLTFTGAADVAEVWLNGHFLGRHEETQEPFDFEVTQWLADRNELLVEVEAPGGHGGLWGEVAMEVRCTAYLRAVRLWATFAGETARVHAAGEVVGACERPLELYVLLDNRTVAYGTAEAASQGQPFHLISEELSIDRQKAHRAKVDLVNGASSWFIVERALAVE